MTLYLNWTRRRFLPTAGVRADRRRKTKILGQVSEVRRPRVVLRVHGGLGDAEGITGRAVSRRLLDEQFLVSVRPRWRHIQSTVYHETCESRTRPV